MSPTTIRDALAAVHPTAPWLALTVATFLACYAIRKWLPRVWRVGFFWVPAEAPGLVRDALQAFGAAAPSAVLGALADGMSVRGALIGMGSGAAASLLHKIGQKMPGPYQGALGKVASKLEQRGAVSLDAAAVCAFVAFVLMTAWLAYYAGSSS